MSDNQREHIIDVAFQKMREIGIKSVSVDDICHELSMSKKTFYVYFETKDLLIDALLCRHEKAMEQKITRSIKGKKIVDLLLNFIRYTNNVNDVRSCPSLIYDLQKYYPEQYKKHLENLEKINFRFITDSLTQGIQENFFRQDIDIDTTASLLTKLHQMLINTLTHTDRREEVERIAKYGMDIIMRGLISEEGKKQIRERLQPDKAETNDEH